MFYESEQEVFSTPSRVYLLHFALTRALDGWSLRMELGRDCGNTSPVGYVLVCSGIAVLETKDWQEYHTNPGRFSVWNISTRQLERSKFVVRGLHDESPSLHIECRHVEVTRP